MRIFPDNSVSRFMLILGMTVSLLFAQAFKFHMHIQHDDRHLPVSAGYIMDTHVAFSLQGSGFDTYQKPGGEGHLHTVDVSHSAGSLLKYIKVFDLLALLLVFIGIIWRLPRLHSARIEYFAKTKLVALYYLFQPPLRAPPG